MIQFPRALARSFREMVRKIQLTSSTSPGSPTVLITAARDRLVLTAQIANVAIEYELLGKQTPAQLAIPITALDILGAEDKSLVSLELAAGALTAHWTDHGTAQTGPVDLIDPKSLAEFPSQPKKWSTTTPSLLRAMCDASGTTDQPTARYALHTIQLCGRAGTVIGTDGRQLFLQSGFGFPFSEDVLVPRAPFLDFSEMPDAVQVGMSNEYLTIRVAPWTFYLKLDKVGQFPKIDSIIPNVSAAIATIRMSADDAEFVSQNLSRLPGKPDAPVTIDCNGSVRIRAIESEQSVPTELVLTHTGFAGETVHCASNRKYLANALRLGFREFRLFGSGSLAYCQDGNRQYMWMGLSEEACVASSMDAVQITSGEAAKEPIAAGKNGKSHVGMPPSSNGKFTGKAVSKPTKNTSSIAAVIAEAQTLRSELHDAYRRSSQLVTSLKRHRSQAKLMRNTIAALRQLGQ